MSLSIKPQNAKKAESVEEAAAKCKAPMIEPKYDGWRFIVEIGEEREVKVWSRTGKPYHQVTPAAMMDEFREFPPHTILDGEIVDHTDNKNCTAVTNVFGKSKAQPTVAEQEKLHFVIFDCLEIDGHRIRQSPLSVRREALDVYFGSFFDFQYIAITPQSPAEDAYYNLFTELGYEGVMVKDNEAPYAEGKRGHGWFKLKATIEIDVVVMSMELDGKGQHEGKVGKFVVGQYQLGELCQRAKVNPYDDAMRAEMSNCQIDAESFGGTNEYAGRVCTIKHYGVLKDGLRHPTFVRWRDDKPAEECGFDNG